MTDYATQNCARAHWSGEAALLHGGKRLLRYTASSWAQVGTDGAQEFGFGRFCVDHIAGLGYYLPGGSQQLSIITLATGATVQSAAVGTAIGECALAWHPHLFDSYAVRHRLRTSEFNGGVVLVEPLRIRLYRPGVGWSVAHTNGSNYAGATNLSAVYVRALDAVLFGGSSVKAWRFKHSTATPAALQDAPITWGAGTTQGTVIDDPTGNGALLLERGGPRAWRWYSRDNAVANGGWTQIANHPFAASFVPCSVETDYVVMGIETPVSDFVPPVVRLWKPPDGSIPRFRGV